MLTTQPGRVGQPVHQKDGRQTISSISTTGSVLKRARDLSNPTSEGAFRGDHIESQTRAYILNAGPSHLSRASAVLVEDSEGSEGSKGTREMKPLPRNRTNVQGTGQSRENFLRHQAHTSIGITSLQFQPPQRQARMTATPRPPSGSRGSFLRRANIERGQQSIPGSVDITDGQRRSLNPLTHHPSRDQGAGPGSNGIGSSYTSFLLRQNAEPVPHGIEDLYADDLTQEGDIVPKDPESPSCFLGRC